MNTFLTAAAVALMATGASAATTGTWSFSLNGGGFYGSVNFTGTDQNNNGIISGTEVTSLRGNYGGGTEFGPSQFGVSFNQTYTNLSYRLDGIFGDTEGDFITYSYGEDVECSYEICDPDQDGLQPSIFESSSFDFSGDIAFASRELNGTPIFIINERIGPQLVSGPISEISAVPLSASSGFLFMGLAGLLTFSRKRKS